MTEELGPLRAVIATGGLAPVVIDECRTVTHHEPMITLIGLRMVYEKNIQGCHHSLARASYPQTKRTGFLGRSTAVMVGRMRTDMRASVEAVLDEYAGLASRLARMQADVAAVTGCAHSADGWGLGDGEPER